MATKTISIMDDAYNLLKKNKLAHESFSDVVRRTFKEKYDISEYIGSWSDIHQKDIRDMKKLIGKRRKYSRIHAVK